MVAISAVGELTGSGFYQPLTPPAGALRVAVARRPVVIPVPFQSQPTFIPTHEMIVILAVGDLGGSGNYVGYSIFM